MQILIEWGVRMSLEEHERFFTELLGNIDEPTAPFGLMDVHLDGSRVRQAYLALSGELSARLRGMAKRLGVSLASLFHLAWGQVLSKATDRADVVFGTVLFGRMQAGEGADQAMGLFINTLPVKLSLDEATVTDSVRQTHQLLADLLRHEHAPLALAQRCSGVSAPAPLFTCLLNYRHNKPMGGDTASHLSDTADLWSGVSSLNSEERTNYPITLSEEDFGQDLGWRAQVLQPLEPARICGYMNKTLGGLVEALEKAPETKIHTVDILPQTERHQLLVEWNATDAAYPKDKCIHELFEEQVARAPDAIALIQDQEQLTYAELNTRANQLAHYLRALGVGPETCVAICVERRPYMVGGLLGILKGGGACGPSDPNYPAERLEFMLEDSSPVSLLADTIGLKTLEGSLHQFSDASFVDLTPPEIWSSYPHTDVSITQTGLTSRNLAYVIYTSGSTGMPKGVMVEHKNVERLFEVTDKLFGFNEQDVWTLFHSVAFDFSVWELWGGLLHGGKVVIVPYFTARSPELFYQLICHQGVTVLNQTPSMFAQVIEAQSRSPEQHSLRVVIFGGEALEIGSLQPWIERNGAIKPQLVNMYGITETTVHVTHKPLQQEEIEGKVPSLIGRPIPDLKIYILDRYRQPVPIGVAGELYIGGAGVARGYLKRAELTAERFLADPFGSAPEGRMYRTGDLARYRSDGNIEFLGRNDFQVKIRGFRIELGEIEARLCEHEDVREAVVIARAEEGEDKRLVAYVTLRESGSSSDLAQGLRAHLAALLPDYMVPSAFVVLERLPLTANGKLDRKALPAPDEKALARQEYEAPVGEIEIVLARVWSELLHVEHVSRQDNFFELGGDSLLAVRLMSRLRRLDLATDIRTLFATPTLSALASQVGTSREIVVPSNLIEAGCQRITPEMIRLADLDQESIDKIIERVSGGVGNIQDIYGLSPLQDGILFHHLLAKEGDPYLLISQMAFSDRAFLDRYLSALQEVVDRHDILRNSFVWEGLSEPVQVVLRQARLSVEELDLDLQKGSIADQVRQRFDPRHHRIDLGQAPLLRMSVAYDGDQWILTQLLHHLIGDHSTLEIQNREVELILSGRRNELLPAQPFRNLVAQARLGMSLEEHERFFTELLGNIDEPTAPFGLMDVHLDGSRVRQAYLALSGELSARLRGMAKRLGVSLASLFHLAWGQVLSKATDRADVVFGTVLFGRMQAGEGADQAMGLFINTLPVKLSLDEATVTDSVRQTHQLLADLLRHEHAPLALAQRCSGVSAPAPLFTCLLNYRHNKPMGGDTASHLSDTADLWSGVSSLNSEERTNYPITLSVEDFGQDLGLTAQVLQPLEPARICGYMHKALEGLVEALEKAPETKIHTVEILPQTERHQLLVEWNATDAAYPKDKCIHELFEEQVARAPDAIALIQDQEQLTYAELNTRANQLAHYLRALGVGPETCVAICVERRPYMVVGLLAILKAGGAYVPLDPNYPAERLEFMLEDSSPVSLLADTIGLKTLEGSLHQFSDASIVDLTHPEIWSSYPHTDVTITQTGLASRNLAYVIYTSGSTGMPKGVMGKHEGLC